MFNDEDKHDIVAVTSEFASHAIKSQYTLEGEDDGEEEMVRRRCSDITASAASQRATRPRRSRRSQY